MPSRLAHLLNVAFPCFLSALLLAWLALWIRSYWTGDLLYNTVHYRTWRIASMRGRITVTGDLYERVPGFDGGVYWLDWSTYGDSMMDEMRPAVAHFAFYSYEGTSTRGPASAKCHSWELVIAHWVIATFLSMPLLLWTLRVRRRRRQSRRMMLALCIGCGYDLRASTDRCPECGLVIPGGHKPPVGTP